MALQASLILRELMDQHIDGKRLLTMESKENGDDTTHSAEFKSVRTGCTKFYNLLCSSFPILNKHLLSVVSSLFLKLGKYLEFQYRKYYHFDEFCNFYIWITLSIHLPS